MKGDTRNFDYRPHDTAKKSSSRAAQGLFRVCLKIRVVFGNPRRKDPYQKHSNERTNRLIPHSRA